MRKPFIFVWAFVLIFAGALLAAAYFTNTERIWRNMLKSVEDLGSAHVSAVVFDKVLIKSPIAAVRVPEESLNLSVLVDGDFEWRDTEAPLISAFSVLQTRTEKESSRVKGEVRYRDRTAFIRLFEIPGSMREALAAYERVWIELPREKLPKEFTPSVWAAKASEGERSRLAELLVKHHPFKLSKKKRTEKIGGTRVYHLVLVPERDLMRKFLLEWEASGRALSRQQVSVIDSELKDILKSKFDVWVGVWDRNLYKFSFVGGGEESLQVALTLTGHNEPVLAELPERAKSADEAKRAAANPEGRLIPAAGRGATSTFAEEEKPKVWDALPQTDISGDADRDGLSDALEAYYGSNPSAYDTDGDGVSDGEEVDSAQNPNGSGGLYDFGFGGQ